MEPSCIAHIWEQPIVPYNNCCPLFAEVDKYKYNEVGMLKCVPYRKAFFVMFFIKSVRYWRFYCILVRGLFLSSAHLPNTNPVVQQVLALLLLLCQHHPDQPVGDSPLTD